MGQSDRRGERLHARKQQGRFGMPMSIIAAAGAAGLLVILALGIFLWPDGDSEATFQPVDSLDYEYSPNHLHGIGYDHVNERLFLASHFGLFTTAGGQLFQVGNERSDLMGLSLNPNDPSEIFVSGHPQGGGNLGVLHSTDAGLNFEQIFTGVDDEIVDFHSMSVSPADPDRFYGAFMGQIYRSDDRGNTFSAFEPAGLPPTGLCWGVPCLAASSDNPDTVYAGTQPGLMVSTDGGENWEMLNDENGQVAAVAVDPETPNRIVAYTEALGVSVSEDGGESWESRQGDLSVGEGGYAFDIALDPTDPDRMFVATMNNHVFETTDGGETWERIV